MLTDFDKLVIRLSTYIAALEQLVQRNQNEIEGLKAQLGVDDPQAEAIKAGNVKDKK